MSGRHRDADKVWFLKVPVPQIGLFGDTVENMAQQFSAAQEQTEVVQHVLTQQRVAAFTGPLAATPQPACCRGQPLASAPAPAPHLEQPPAKQCRGTGGSQAACPSWPPLNLAVSGTPRGPGTGDPTI